MPLMLGIHPNIMPIRMTPNPLDKCTIVSIYPKRIYDNKPMIFPGLFMMEPAKANDFEILVIGPSSWFKEMEEGQPYLEITSSSMVMAESFIKDWCAQVGVEYGSKMPGLFYVPGSHDKNSIKALHQDKLDQAEIRQKEFFRNLVAIADVMWARTNGNPLVISEDAKLGAQYLGLTDKPWIKDFQATELRACLACGEFINYRFPVCRFCKAIVNPELAGELKIKFAV
jgi:hypothetical protein